MSFVQPGGLILVTGASGYVGGVTIQKFLDNGYRVRGTARDVSKYSWMLSHYGPKFTLVQVPDIAAEGALDEAVKGVDGIAHIASPTTEGFQPDPQIIIPHSIRCAIGLLESAAKEPSVKSVIYTSSQAATFMMTPGKQYHVTPESWNEESKVAWTMPVTPDFRRAALNYMCAKTEAEQQSFKWVQEHAPHFTFNTVVPNVNFGTIARPDQTGFLSSSAALKILWEGSPLPVTLFPPEYYVDVEDTALLHVAVLTRPDVQNERIFAFAGRYCYNNILDIFRKISPTHTFLDKVEETLDNGTVENQRAEELLKSVKNGIGFTSLEDTVKKWSVCMLKADREGREWPTSSAEQMMRAFESLPADQQSMFG